MLDPLMRRLIDPPLRRAGATLARAGIGADGITLLAFVAGLAAAAAVALGQTWIGLALLALNRLGDGLDGAVARATGATDRGAFLDIVLDFVFYGLMVLGFAVAAPQNALPAAFLLASFMGTGASFLGYAVLAGKRGLSTDLRGRKSFFHMGGLTEGTETIAFLVLCCLFPQYFPLFAWIFGAACWLTALSRVVAGWQDFAGGPGRD
ncbi:CDP-alcohol phosphatidyltransferase family protein [Marinibaculum pumilum]|uniref:CDP-alcohol phosphatidyltransferase family protein n=1 Tax=Marinibaculum pumilum TaxID=1766165 RepID=A0ABV7L2X2_9PROT